MKNLSLILTGLVALLHLWFLTLEMFLWKTPLGRKTFQMTEEFANTTSVLAANQGLYNGFLVAGLVWGMLRNDFSIIAFFLICVIIAGVYGGITANVRIFFIQSMPAILALIVNYLVYKN